MRLVRSFRWCASRGVLATVLASLAGLSHAACSTPPVEVTDAGQTPLAPAPEAGALAFAVPDYDGPSWTGAVPYPGVWRAVSGLPEGCGVRLSATPATSVASLQWRACASGEDGCDEADLPSNLGYPTLPEHATFHEDARGVHVWFSFLGRDAEWSIMWDLGGATELVAYSPRGQGCVLRVGSSARGYEMHAGINLTYETHSYAVRAPHDAPLRTTVTTLSTALYLTGALRWLGYGDGFVFTDSRLIAIEPGPSSPPLAKKRFAATIVEGVAGGVLAVDLPSATSRDVTFFPVASGAPTVVVPVPQGRQVEYLAVDPASGDLIHVESEGANHDTVRIYASPVSTTGPFASRVVGRVPRANFSKSAVALNAGTLFVGPSDRPSRLTRLSDGAYWEIGSMSEAPVFVTKDRVWTMVIAADGSARLLQRPFPTWAPSPTPP